jgi:NAD(P)-dependent dehydrogenase (short-subunit alcohol dehydrogenase family)
VAHDEHLGRTNLTARIAYIIIFPPFNNSETLGIIRNRVTKGGINMDLGLTGKVALVTGAASQKGFGKGIATGLAKEGCDIVAADIDLEGAERTAAIIQDLGRKALAVKVDVADAGQVNEMVRTVLARFGKIDVLVNNAGAASPSKPFWEKSEAEWDRDINVNLKGAMNCTKAVIGQMVEKKNGKIINISSVAARIGAPYSGSYAAAKAGIIGLTKSLALEVSHLGINVNGIAPGLGLTNFVKNDPPELIESLTERTPTKRTTTPEDIANIVAFLASDVSGNIVGQTFSVDGGLSMY